MYKDYKVLTGKPVSAYVTRFELATPETADLTLSGLRKATQALEKKLNSLGLIYRFNRDDDVRIQEAQFYKVAHFDNMFATTHIQTVLVVAVVEIDLPLQTGLQLLQSNGFR